jgi:nitrite reductase (cytochrome c-552)
MLPIHTKLDMGHNERGGGNRTMATRQEMRSYVYGQYHVENHFQGAEKRLVYPWAQGLQVDNLMAFYDAVQFKGWVHAETKARAETI